MKKRIFFLLVLIYAVALPKMLGSQRRTLTLTLFHQGGLCFNLLIALMFTEDTWTRGGGHGIACRRGCGLMSCYWHSMIIGSHICGDANMKHPLLLEMCSFAGQISSLCVAPEEQYILKMETGYRLHDHFQRGAMQICGSDKTKPNLPLAPWTVNFSTEHHGLLTNFIN